MNEQEFIKKIFEITYGEGDCYMNCECHKKQREKLAVYYRKLIKASKDEGLK